MSRRGYCKGCDAIRLGIKTRIPWPHTCGKDKFSQTNIKTMTKGEKMVRIDFNVSGSGHVTEIKKRVAELINYIEDMQIDAEDQGEVSRAKALAQTSLQQASWAAVFAATSKAKTQMFR